MTSLVKLEASCSDELIFLQQLCKVDWDSQKWVEVKKRVGSVKKTVPSNV